MLVNHLPDNFVGGHDEAKLAPAISTEDSKPTQACWTGLLLFLSTFEVDFLRMKNGKKKKSEELT